MFLQYLQLIIFVVSFNEAIKKKIQYISWQQIPTWQDSIYWGVFLIAVTKTHNAFCQKENTTGIKEEIKFKYS